MRLEIVGKSIADCQLRDAVPDEATAERLFIEWFSPGYNGIRCPRCAWPEPAEPASRGAGQPYRCRRCRKTFSIKTETVMARSPLSAWQWVQALHIWTGGVTACSSEELARRIGVDDNTARDITMRILRAAREELPPLREPAEMTWFTLGANPRFKRNDQKPQTDQSSTEKSSATAIAVVGLHSGQTRIGTITEVNRREVEKFVEEHLVEGMNLFTSAHAVNQAVTWDRAHFLPSPESSYLLQDLRERIRTWLRTVHNRVSDEHLPEYLIGYQWRENNRQLSHGARMRRLAEGMMWKTPPPSTTEKKRGKQNQDDAAKDEAGQQR